MNDETTIHDLAAKWALERADGLTPARHAALQQWLDADPRHAAALREAELTFGALQGLGEYEREPEVAVGRRSNRVFWAGSAIGLAAAAAIAVMLVQEPAPRPEVLEVTAATEPVQSRLSDGSVVSVNTKGVAAIEITSSHRRVKLSGEGHFQVAPEANRPFTVEAAGWSVTAVGTAFTVAAEAGDLKVTVTEGVVALQRADGSSAATKLSAGEIAQVNAGARAPNIYRAAAETLATPASWQAGFETFNSVSLGDLVQRFNAAGPVRFVLVDDMLKDRRIGGTFSLENVEVFLSLIQQDGSIVVERVSPAEVRLRAARP